MGGKILKYKIAYKVREMIKQEILGFLGEKGIALEGDLQSANTFEIIDSMGFLELLNFLEQRTGAELDLSALDLEDFATLGGLIESLEKILKAQNARL